MSKKHMEPAVAVMPTDRQVLFVRYTLAILIDLVILNLFSEYWDRVHIETFSISLLAAVLLQILLQVALKIEHRTEERFRDKEGLSGRIQFFAAVWGVLLVSKFVMLWIVDKVFGESFHFVGKLDGALPFIVVIVTMLVAEGLVGRLYRILGNSGKREAIAEV